MEVTGDFDKSNYRGARILIRVGEKRIGLDEVETLRLSVTTLPKRFAVNRAEK